MGSTTAKIREAHAADVLLVVGYTERMASGTLIPSSLAFMATVMEKLPPAESPTNMIRSAVVPTQ